MNVIDLMHVVAGCVGIAGVFLSREPRQQIKFLLVVVMAYGHLIRVENERHYQAQEQRR